MQNAIVLFFLSLSFSTFAQTPLAPEIQAGLYQAFIQNNPELWEQHIKTIEEQYEASQDIDLLYELTNAYYGMAGTYMGNKNQLLAESSLDKAISHIKILLMKKPKSPEVHALQAGIYGLQMGFSPMSGMTLGPKSTKHLNKSLKLDSENPKGNYQMGGSYFFTPAMFGGSTKKAIEYYQKSVEAFEKQGQLTNNWEYLTALTWLGQAYAEYKDLENAKATFEKALAFEPQHLWVKNHLLPAVCKD